MLRKFRITLSLIVLTLITFYFLDFAGLAPAWLSWLPKIQFMTALLAGAWVTVGSLLLLTMLFGRIYCSVICPLGIMQDIFNWLSKRYERIFRKKRKRFLYSRPRTILRWAVVALCIVSFIAAQTLLVGLLDPYSAYGRIAASLLKPVYMAVNNLLASVFTGMGVYTFYKVEVAFYGFTALVTAAVTLLVVGYMAWRRGRLYCNTVCPVGTVLGFVSRWSLFKIRLEESQCNSCGLCAMNCKSQCIDIKNHKVDHSRCVVCFDCMEGCPKKGVKYSPRFGSFGRKAGDNREQAAIESSAPDSAHTAQAGKAPSVENEGRRRFLLTSLVTAATVPVIAAQEKTRKIVAPKQYVRKNPLSPPGSLSHGNLNMHCTSCHLCVSKCPSNILKPSWREYGWGGIMQPVMSFEKGFCNYDCTVCSNVCPAGAIKPLKTDEKHLTQVGQVVFMMRNCIVYTHGTSCGACSEHCPTQAIAMVPYTAGAEGLTIPRINRKLCIGCGGCEFICPAEPYKAVIVEGNPVHKQAEPFDRGESSGVRIDDFGF